MGTATKALRPRIALIPVGRVITHTEMATALRTGAGEPDTDAASAKVQKRFRTLTDQIAAERAALATWQDFKPAYLSRCAAELEPLQARHRAARIEVVHALDRAARHADLGSSQRTKVRDLLLDYLESLLGGSRDADLEVLYNRHSGQDYSDLLAEREALQQRILSPGRGDRAPATEDAAEVEDAQEDADAGTFRDDGAGQRQQDDPDRARRKREARKARRSGSNGSTAPSGLTRALLRRQAEDAAAQSLRDLYRKLAFALHPDREPDPAEQARKTQLLQQANQAYAARDLLTLLRMQQQHQGASARFADTMPGERLRPFILLLEDQLAALRRELLELQAPFLAVLYQPVRGKLMPAHVEAALEQDLAELRGGIKALKAEAVRLHDLDDLKRRLKGQRRR